MSAVAHRNRQATPPSFVPPSVLELTEPVVVGKWYLVPQLPDDDGNWMPVRLPVRDDAGTPWDHAHIDERFVTAR
ncbi:MAG: hypothetical protein JO290_11925, partial [Sphingomonadaceae bacterium]|nr:hypothetical protein [Sphingomonadaceae bacterium]